MSWLANDHLEKYDYFFTILLISAFIVCQLASCVAVVYIVAEAVKEVGG